MTAGAFRSMVWFMFRFTYRVSYWRHRLSLPLSLNSACGVFVFRAKGEKSKQRPSLTSRRVSHHPRRVCILIASVFFSSPKKIAFFRFIFIPLLIPFIPCRKSVELSAYHSHTVFPVAAWNLYFGKSRRRNPKENFISQDEWWGTRVLGWCHPLFPLPPPPPPFVSGPIPAKNLHRESIPCELGMCGKFVLIFFCWEKMSSSGVGRVALVPCTVSVCALPVRLSINLPFSTHCTAAAFFSFFPLRLEWIVRRIVRIAHGRTKNRRKSRTPLLDAVVGLCWGGGDGEKKARRMK